MKGCHHQEKKQQQQQGDGAMARSPSRESVATDLSLLSLSSYGGETLRVPIVPRGASPCSDTGDEELRRGTSPVPSSSARGSLLQLPSSGRKSACTIGETLFEEESELIRSCGILSSALGLRRSFSTSDIVHEGSCGLSSFASEVALSAAAAAATAAVVGAGLDTADLADRRVTGVELCYASRSCSTWVAVGDMASASQLPSPQGREPQLGDAAPLISAADLIRSMNKKVRQGYIKRRLLTTYKALERMAQTEGAAKVSRARVSREILKLLRKDLDPQYGGTARSLSLTAKDVEREKGKALTRYERNMMIFRWLHSLDKVTTDTLC